MELRPEEIEYKRKVGHLGSNPILEVGLRGGLHLILQTKGGKIDTLALAPHPAVAKFLAKKKEPDIEWTDLQKSEYVDPAHFADILPKYEALTDAIRAKQGLK